MKKSRKVYTGGIFGSGEAVVQSCKEDERAITERSRRFLVGENPMKISENDGGICGESGKGRPGGGNDAV